MRRRDTVRARWAELATYALMAAGLVLVIEVAAYRYYASSSQYFEQARYLFPLLALYGGDRGACRPRRRPALGPRRRRLPRGAVHGALSVLDVPVIARYYA